MFMPAGLEDLELLLCFRYMPTRNNDFWDTSLSNSATCQRDLMIFGLVRMWLNDLLTQMPTGHNDLWASENVKVRNSKGMNIIPPPRTLK
jgi:hypothetical protein